MRKSNNHPFFEYWEDRKANEEFSVHFSHGGRIPITPDNREEILAAAKKLYGGDYVQSNINRLIKEISEKL